MLFRLVPVCLLLVALLTTAQVAPQANYEPNGIAYEDTVAMLIVMIRFQDDYRGDCERWWCHLDMWPHIDLFGTGEEIPRTRVPWWAYTLLKESPEEVRASNLTFADSSLSAYFYWQSLQGEHGPHILYGDVWPEVYITEKPNSAYYNRRDSMGVEVVQDSGFGYLTRELLDNLTADGLDLGSYDHNRDGMVDHIMMLIRDDSLHHDQGWAQLAGYFRAGGAPDSDGNGRADTLRYWSTTLRDSIYVDYSFSGSQIFTQRNDQNLIIHEYGHRLLDYPGHIAIIRDPVHRDRERKPCSYARMCGAPHTYDVASTPLSVYERRRAGWVDPIVITVGDGDREGLTIRDLYTTGDAVLIPLDEGAAGDTLEIGNRQRIGFFDTHRTRGDLHPNYDYMYKGLATTGLDIAVTKGVPSHNFGRQRSVYGFLPADGWYEHYSKCSGSVEHCLGPWPYDGDLFRPDTKAQLTPWTRPNTAGFMRYPSTDVTPQWFAIDDIRFVPGVDSTMQFDFVSDVRRRPSYLDETEYWPVFRADSWLGWESDGLVLDDGLILNDVSVYVGVDTSSTTASGLASTQPVSVSFREGLTFEGSARLLIGAGSQVWIGNEQYESEEQILELFWQDDGVRQREWNE